MRLVCDPSLAVTAAVTQPARTFGCSVSVPSHAFRILSPAPGLQLWQSVQSVPVEQCLGSSHIPSPCQMQLSSVEVQDVRQGAHVWVSDVLWPVHASPVLYSTSGTGDQTTQPEVIRAI